MDAHGGHLHVDQPVIEAGGSSSSSGTIGLPIHNGSVTITPYVSAQVIGGHGSIASGGLSATVVVSAMLVIA